MTFDAPRAVDRSNAEHYAWGGVSDGWRLLAEGDLSVIEERAPPGASETRHVHTRARQFFRVLEGRAEIEIGGRIVPLDAGQGVHVPPGVPHRFANRSAADVRFLVISSPTTAGDRTEVGDQASPA